VDPARGDDDNLAGVDDVARGVRWLPLAALGVVLAAWGGLQLWLSHRRVEAIHAQLVAGIHRLNALALAQGRPTHPVPAPDPAEVWVHGGEQSLITALLLTAVAAVLVLGGRRWWAAIVAGVPLANVVGRFQDGTPLGYGWWQEGPSTQTWFAIGAFVDAAMLLTVVALLIRALPAPSIPSLSAAGRGAVAAVVLTAWWIVRIDTTDPDHRVWFAQAVAFILIAALIASSALPFAVRMATVVLVLPIAAMVLTEDIVFVGLRRPTFDGMEFVHHALVATAVMAYVAGVPALARARTSKPAVTATV
jgi:hypothetical protein